MKYAIVIAAGVADEPVKVLEGRTPLEAADTPHVDWISVHGRQGRVGTIPEGFDPGADVAALSLMGYDPERASTGLAPMEAAMTTDENHQAKREAEEFRPKKRSERRPVSRRDALRAVGIDRGEPTEYDRFLGY